MQKDALIHRGLQLSGVFIAAAIATFALFLVMLALIATSFETREASARTVEIVEIDVPEIQPQMKAKKLEKDISLLEAVVLPPAKQNPPRVRSKL